MAELNEGRHLIKDDMSVNLAQTLSGATTMSPKTTNGQHHLISHSDDAPPNVELAIMAPHKKSSSTGSTSGDEFTKSRALRVKRLATLSPENDDYPSPLEKKERDPNPHLLAKDGSTGKRQKLLSQDASSSVAWAVSGSSSCTHYVHESHEEMQNDGSPLSDLISSAQALSSEQRMLAEANTELLAGIEDLKQQLALALAANR